MQNDLFHQLAAGGPGIWVIGALSVLLVTVAVERLHRLRMSALVSAGLVDAIVPLWEAERFDEVEAVLARHRSILGQALRFVLINRSRWTAEVLGERVGEVTSRALRTQAQRAYALTVVATVAPIVGLLGTVVAMIDAFRVIGFNGATVDAALLADGISKALVNTAAGLSVALPALVLHHLLRHRLTVGTLALEEQIDRLLDRCVRPGVQR